MPTVVCPAGARACPVKITPAPGRNGAVSLAASMLLGRTGSRWWSLVTIGNGATSCASPSAASEKLALTITVTRSTPADLHSVVAHAAGVRAVTGTEGAADTGGEDDRERGAGGDFLSRPCGLDHLAAAAPS